jgi:peptidoglycan/LPS O-acetylase OafA/YrhL
MVMVFHFAKYRPQTISIFHTVVFRSIDLGWTGVDLFFVLSGFLITGILLDSKGSPGYLKVFYVRRALRILPLYYLGVILCFWVAPFIATRFLHWNWPQVSGYEQIWYWLYVANWRTGFYPLLYPIATHFWSLAIEEQFYLFWPVVVLVCSRARLLQVSLIGVASAFVLRNLPFAQSLSAAYPNSLFRLTPFRVDVLLFGAIAAIVIRDTRLLNMVKRRIPTIILAASVAVGLVLFASGSTSPHSELMTRLGYSAVGVAFASMVLYCSSESGGKSRTQSLLRSPFLRHFGKYSYAMYVFHIPVSTFLPRLPEEPWGGLLTGLCAVVTGIAITDVIARVSWYALETPFLQWRNRFANPQPKPHKPPVPELP